MGCTTMRREQPHAHRLRHSTTCSRAPTEGWDRNNLLRQERHWARCWRLLQRSCTLRCTVGNPLLIWKNPAVPGPKMTPLLRPLEARRAAASLEVPPPLLTSRIALWLALLCFATAPVLADWLALPDSALLLVAQHQRREEQEGRQASSSSRARCAPREQVQEEANEGWSSTMETMLQRRLQRSSIRLNMALVARVWNTITRMERTAKRTERRSP
jgi:hypothetical protein